MFHIKQKSLRQFLFICALFGGLLGGALSAASQTTTTQFTYQGRLTDGAMPANGNYDMQFQVCANADCTFVFGSPVAMSPVPVTNGIFTVTLDFGDVFNSTFSTIRYLRISVRQTGNAGAYTTLSPAQRITAAPGAIRSQQSNNADALGNVAANQYVQTGDARLSDARSPIAGSNNYIQNNPAAAQTGGFYVSGNGRVGGTLTTFDASVSNNLSVQGNVTSQGMFSGSGSGLTALNAANISTGTLADARLSSNIPLKNAANTFSGTQSAGIFNAATQFNLNGNPFISAPGSTNLFAGFGAGGTGNTGASNSFFGTSAGAANTSGASNVFVGRNAGLANTTGSDNTFIGTGAGGNNTTGSNNTLLGAGASLGANNLT